MNHFIASLFHIIFLFLIYVKCDIYDGKFFDPQNYTDANCTVEYDYIYLGNKSTTNKNINCEIWSTVRNYQLKLFDGYNQFYFADEYMDYNYCRNIPLDAYQLDHRFNNASAHNYVQSDGWKYGPWCYAKAEEESNETLLWDGFNKTEYLPMPCFEQCSGEKQRVTNPPLPPKEKNETFKYNNNLIKSLAQNLFSNFDSGSKKYYESKPSDKTVSADFQSNATIIFYVGMSLLILAVVAIFAKHYYSKWKKRSKAFKKDEKEIDKKEEPAENNQTENVNGPEAVTDTQKISNETQIGTEKTTAAEIQKVSTENTNKPEAKVTAAEMQKVSNETLQNQNKLEMKAAEMQKVSNENQNGPEVKAAEKPKISTTEKKPTPQKRKLRKR